MSLEEYQKNLADRKRQAILTAAVKHFLAVGYGATTLEMVAKDASVSTATVYKHFATKADLFGGIMAQVWQAERVSTSPISMDLSPQAALVKIGQEYAELLNSPNIRPLFRLVIAEANRFPELGKELYLRGKEPFLKRLEAYLKEQEEEGMLYIDDIAIATRQFLGMINDAIFWPHFLIIDLEQSEAEVQKIIVSATDTFLARYKRG
jgi:TetR/AcrR family transcriptional regulator, regulator of autoinduction and epiphytic fitness